MSLVTRTYTFTDGTTAFGSQVESEIANLANTINGLDAGTTTWDIVKAVNGSATPLIADNSTGSNNIFEARANGVAKVTVGSGGLITAVAGATISGAALTMSGQTIAMGSNKITGLADGTATADAVAFHQLKVIQVVVGTTQTARTITTSTTFVATNCAVTITPTSASNKILILATGALSAEANGEQAYVTLERGTTNLANTNGFGRALASTVQIDQVASVHIVDSPATTSATTYTIFIKSGGGASVAWGDNTSSQTILAMEVAS